MTELFHTGDPILFMKVGTHATESLEVILARKLKEIDDAGFAMWGYGGNSCHPRTMVQPFARSHEEAGSPIRLVMQPMNSRHFADKVRAQQYSSDGIDWLPVPDEINVLGSRFALCIENLRETDASLVLDETVVALGRSKGKVGKDYISGHVDKACLEVVADAGDGPAVNIGLVADVIAPYAVLLK